ncbi:hypothetical protein [Deinococcus sp. UR1]|uniref:hypothetical protein n=1 Tax=Deinococcus sp. UR1 TaxID=1704277 RepID=UPI0006DC9484|nr:hypothetical protein [Deinococcus sp. UR1]PIH00291.1 hypothetical protein AMD26_001605 [Deinococcus sp. UR1]
MDGEESATKDLVLLDLYCSGSLSRELREFVEARLRNDVAFERLYGEYLTDWADLLDMLAPAASVPDGSEERLMQRLRAELQE